MRNASSLKALWSQCRYILNHNATSTKSRFFAQACMDIDIVYQSPNFIVINKPYDVVINSNDDSKQDTVANWLQLALPHLVDPNTLHGFRFAHRLDFATSGLLCLALNKKAAGWAFKLFSSHKVSKHYLALVYGHLATDCDPPGFIRVVCPIGKDTKAIEEGVHKMTTPDSPHCSAPKHACTDVILLEQGLYNEEPASKVLLIPKTGRSHQLRVHCLHIGHRIIGDFMYSNRADSDKSRMMLHSYRLQIPMVQEHLDIKSYDPFLTDVDSLWKPQMVYRVYENCLDEISKYVDS